MSEWISVKERLPEDDCYVLCVSVSAEGVKRIGIRFFTRNALKPNGDFLLNQELSLIVVGDKITHWMPLPKPPSGDLH